MDKLVIASVLIAALSHASWHAIIKSNADKLLSLAWMNLVSGGIFLLALPFVPIPDLEIFLILLLSIFLHAAYKLGLAHVYDHGDFTQVFPIARGMAPIFAMLLALFLLEELPTSEQVASVLLVSMGLIALSRGWDDDKLSWRLLLLAGATGLMAASYSVVDAYGIKMSGEWMSFMVWLMVLDGLLFLTIVRVLRGRELWRGFLKNPVNPLISGVLGTAGFVVFLWALSQGSVGVVSALRETSILFACLIGVYVLKEKWSVIRAVGAFMVTIGVVTIALQR